MAGTYDLADLISFGERFGPGGNPAGGGGDIGFHMGTITEWDARSGENTLMVAGGTVSNVPVLSTADSIMLTPGDTVGLIRFKSTYFILGRIASPGGGAALRARQEFARGQVSTTNSSWVDLAGGPTVSDVYVGTSRRVLVMFSANCSAANAFAQATIAVSGASNITDSAGGTPISVGGFDAGDTSANGRVMVNVTSTAVQVFDASVGLNSGLNHFRMQYRRSLDEQFSTQDPALFSNRRIVVLPF